MNVNLWSSAELALDYLGRADSIPHRVEAESTLLELVPESAQRILDLGTGDGRLLALVKLDHPDANAVRLIFLPPCWRPHTSAFPAIARLKSCLTIWKNPFPS
jgi:hypothetical protein